METDLPSEKILSGVPPLRFWGEGAVGWYCLAGAVTRYLDFMGTSTPYHRLMGISGAAWRLVWNRGRWSPDNLIMQWYGDRAAEKRIFRSLGYSYRFVDRNKTDRDTDAPGKDGFFAMISREIDRGRPAIACGIAGPEECLVAGYRADGQALFVTSFFEHGDGGYKEVVDWYEHVPQGEYEGHSFQGLHVVEKKNEPPPGREILLESLQWGLQMAAMADAGGRATGVAAYDAWAEDMLRDDDFPMADVKRLEQISMSVSDNGIVILDARKAASEYLNEIKPAFRPESARLLGEAADLFLKESQTIGAAHELIPWGNVKGDELVRRMGRKNREKIACVIRDCRESYAGAFAKVRAALVREGIRPAG